VGEARGELAHECEGLTPPDLLLQVERPFRLCFELPSCGLEPLGQLIERLGHPAQLVPSPHGHARSGLALPQSPDRVHDLGEGPKHLSP
jgi:hypothetical protein